MTNVNELIERLRTIGAQRTGWEPTSAVLSPAECKLLAAAVDDLRAERDTARKFADAWGDSARLNRANGKGFRAMWAETRRERDDLRQQRDALATRNAQLSADLQREHGNAEMWREQLLGARDKLTAAEMWPESAPTLASAVEIVCNRNAQLHAELGAVQATVAQIRALVDSFPEMACDKLSPWLFTQPTAAPERAQSNTHWGAFAVLGGAAPDVVDSYPLETALGFVVDEYRAERHNAARRDALNAVRLALIALRELPDSDPTQQPGGLSPLSAGAVDMYGEEPGTG